MQNYRLIDCSCIKYVQTFSIRAGSLWAGHSGQTALRLLGPRHKHMFWLVIGGHLSVCYGLAPHNEEEAAINLSRADWSIELSVTKIFAKVSTIFRESTSALKQT